MQFQHHLILPNFIACGCTYSVAVAINTEKDRWKRKGPTGTEKDRKYNKKDRKDTEKDRKDTEKDHNDTESIHAHTCYTGKEILYFQH